MRYYAEWLDGEYVLLRHVRPDYDHFATMQRSIRFHALFGSTLVLSDAQMIDLRTPITTLFLNRSFRDFLKVRPNFLALTADPAQGIKEQGLAIAMKGLERLSVQANKSADSFEMAITELGGPIFHAGYFDAERYLDPGHKEKGKVGRVIRRFPQYSRELKGLLHVVDYFSRSPLPTTTTRLIGNPGRYDTLLHDARNELNLLSGSHTRRVEEILRIQEQKIPKEQHGRRAAIRKVLGTGKWHDEEWTPENLTLYLDIVHAWNCAINRSIVPEGGTLYESRDSLPLSRYKSTVTDKIGWTRAGPMPYTNLSDKIQRFLFWDPLDSDWELISKIVHGTQETCAELQASLATDDAKGRSDALSRHASAIANHLVNVPIKEISPWVWWIAKAFGTATDAFDTEWVDVAEEVSRDGPQAYASIQRMMVVNTIADAAPSVLQFKPDK